MALNRDLRTYIEGKKVAKIFVTLVMFLLQKTMGAGRMEWSIASCAQFTSIMILILFEFSFSNCEMSYPLLSMNLLKTFKTT